jgi:hypothetical protein
VVVIAVPESPIDVLLVPADDDLEPGDWVWPRQVSPLYDALRRHRLDLREPAAAPVSGHKGTASEIIVALGSSGAIGAMVTVLHAWLTQRSTRRVSLTFGRPGAEQTITLTAEGLSEDSARQALLAALGRSLPDEPDPGELPAGDTPDR